MAKIQPAITPFSSGNFHRQPALSNIPGLCHHFYIRFNQKFVIMMMKMITISMTLLSVKNCGLDRYPVIIPGNIRLSTEHYEILTP